MRRAKRKTKGRGLWNWIKRHKIISGILILLIICFLVMAMTLGALLWNLNKDKVGVGRSGRGRSECGRCTDRAGGSAGIRM